MTNRQVDNTVKQFKDFIVFVWNYQLKRNSKSSKIGFYSSTDQILEITDTLFFLIYLSDIYSIAFSRYQQGSIVVLRLVGVVDLKFGKKFIKCKVWETAATFHLNFLYVRFLLFPKKSNQHSVFLKILLHIHLKIFKWISPNRNINASSVH